MYIGETVMAALELEGELFVINTYLVKDGCMEIMHADGITDDIVRIVVRFADRLTGLDSASSQPH